MSNVIAKGISSTLKETEKEVVRENINSTSFNGVYPIGSIYTNLTNPANPSTYLEGAAGTTWQSLAGRVIVGVGTVVDSRGVSTTFTANQTGGETAHVQTAAELASHSHQMIGGSTSGSNSVFSIVGGGSEAAVRPTGTTGSNSPMNVMQPYQTAYMWVRTA